MAASRRPNGTPAHRARGIRVPDERWDRARDIAYEDEMTMSALINEMLEQYIQTGGKSLR